MKTLMKSDGIVANTGGKWEVSGGCGGKTANNATMEKTKEREPIVVNPLGQMLHAANWFVNRFW